MKCSLIRENRCYKPQAAAIMPDQTIQVGDVFQIPLPNHRYAFGCVLRDAAVGIYPGIHRNPTPEQALLERRYAFVTGIYSDVLPSGKCPIVGRRTFRTENEQWPPPQCALDAENKSVSIYYKGRFTPCRPEDVVGLELVQVCELTHIIDRIVKTQNEHD
jgi:hypothetical protein